jgi:hypothetical protein
MTVEEYLSAFKEVGFIKAREICPAGELGLMVAEKPQFLSCSTSQHSTTASHIKESKPIESRLRPDPVSRPHLPFGVNYFRNRRRPILSPFPVTSRKRVKFWKQIGCHSSIADYQNRIAGGSTRSERRGARKVNERKRTC